MRRNRMLRAGLRSAAGLLLSAVLSVTCAIGVSAAVDVSQTEFAVESDSWSGWPAGPSIQGETGAVIDAETGEVLYGKGLEVARYPASITKVMTALLVLEHCDLSATVTMSETAMQDAYAGSSNCAPQLGEVFTIEQCLQMLLIKSANDVATLLAEYVGGSVQGFADLMNAKAAELGCVNTHFANANGLEDENHYTCVYDMALIMREAMQYIKFREIIGLQNVTIPATNLSSVRYYETHVAMLIPESPYYYAPCTGGKTGYTDISKSTLIVSAEKNGRTLIGVIMGHTDGAMINSDLANLLTYGFDSFRSADVTMGMELISGETVLLPTDASLEDLTLETAETADAVQLTFLYQGRSVGTAEIAADQVAAYAAAFEKRAEEETVTVAPTQESTSEGSTDAGSAEKTHAGLLSGIALYVVIGVLGLLILICIILIFITLSREKKRKKRRRRR